MAFKFDDAYNKFAKSATSLNRGVNKIIGKDVFKDVKEIEAPREFPPYSSFPEYEIPEPEQWSPKNGDVREFTLVGNVVSVSANLDACIQYRNEFKTSAKYYAERFEFKYKNCVQDFDSLIHYFEDLYLEGLQPMLDRAYSVLLPFGIFSASIEDFSSRHINTYKRALTSCQKMAGIELSKNERAQQTGNQVGNAMRLQGGGFGFKGAMKGIAQAEAFNIGMGMLGKIVSNNNKMTQEEKEKVFTSFKQDVFFQEVYSDYFNTFLTMVQTLSDNNELNGVKTIINAEYSTMIKNLQNPMFPKEKVAPALVKLVSSYPFEMAGFKLLQERFGQTEEVKNIISYFIG